jgi:hypothetical protein
MKIYFFHKDAFIICLKVSLFDENLKKCPHWKKFANFSPRFGFGSGSVFVLKPRSEKQVSTMFSDFVCKQIYIPIVPNVAEPVYFCAAPAPACQKFRLRLRPFSPYIFEKNQKFSWFQKNFMLLKTKNDHKKVL